MQLGQAQIVRSEWYDRSLLTSQDTYNAVVAPHALAVKATYTVPANRVAIVSILPISIRRATAAAPVGYAEAYYSTSTASSGNNAFPTMKMYSNNVDDSAVYPVSIEVMLVAGDTINFYTRDTSTGGTVGFSGGFLVSEYDA